MFSQWWLRRVALHKYDPPDLVTNKPISEEPKKADIFAAVPVVTRRTQQLEEAEAQGLLVDFGPAQSLDSGTMDAGSPISVMTQSSKCSLIDEFSSARNLSDDEDSDDDLL